MSTDIAIVDYGTSNLSSVKNAFDHLGRDSVITHDEKTIADARAIILPGVGAFGIAMAHIRERNLDEILMREVVEKGKPFLGICLGMQLVAKDSEEKGMNEGLGWVDAVVRRIPVGEELRLPHIGWNDLTIREGSPLFAGLGDDRNFYFVHSFSMVCDEKYIEATCEYGVPVVASVRKDNILATQFHPEKSHVNGRLLLKNFLNFMDKNA